MKGRKTRKKEKLKEKKNRKKIRQEATEKSERGGINAYNKRDDRKTLFLQKSFQSKRTVQ